jgi:hypothetical protein
MYKLAIGIGFGLLLFCNEAMAACPALTRFSNAQTADANQVMGNFDTLMGCTAQVSATNDLGLGAPPNIGGYPNGRFLTIRGAGGTTFAADGRIELTNPNTPANGNNTGEIVFEQEGNGGDIRTVMIYGTAGGAGGAGGLGGALTFATKKDNNTGQNAIQMDNAGNFYPGTSGTQKLGQLGSLWSAVYATNGTIQTSDIRLKKNVAPLGLGDGLSGILKLRPVTFQWKERVADTATHYGFVAQEVQQIFPKVVDTGSDAHHTLGMNYPALIPSMVAAIQEVDRKVGRASYNNIRALQVRLRRQDAHIAALEAANSNELTELGLLRTELNHLQHRVELQSAQR